MFSLLLCLADGITPIITSSSDRKLQQASSLGPEGATSVINYRTHREWEQEVLRLTNGRGVAFIVETVGGVSIKKSVTSVATRGTIS
jgi:NADPH:quinone reductase-like Zn-dependent oxidoreductase